MKYAPALFLWLMAELVVFQPNEYDNNKLLYPAFAFLCCAASNCTFTLLEKLKGKAARKGAAVSLAALCSVSAVLTMGRETVSLIMNCTAQGRGAGRICRGTVPAGRVVSLICV